MFPCHSHVLAPLTFQVGKKRLVWTDECEASFKQLNAMLAKDVFIQYPNHNEPFHVHADASDYQLGSVILQQNKPVAYYSRKLNAAQKNYTVGEKEILSIVEALKEYRTMLYGCKELRVYTDHKNNTFEKFTTQRVLRWCLLLDEFGPIFHHIAGKDNPLADALSRLGISERQNTEAAANSAAISVQIPSPNSLDSFFPWPLMMMIS